MRSSHANIRATLSLTICEAQQQSRAVSAPGPSGSMLALADGCEVAAHADESDKTTEAEDDENTNTQVIAPTKRSVLTHCFQSGRH